MEDPSANRNEGKRTLNLFDCVCIIVGTIIGAGIFKTPSVIASLVPGIGWLFGVWIIGGVIALIGALCFAELTTTYPDAGGDYGYLKRGFHRKMGFAFSWCAFWVVRPCNIGTMAVICGEFAYEVFPGLTNSEMMTRTIFSTLAVLVITGINLLGVSVGKSTQNVLTVVKVLGILTVILAALAIWPDTTSSQPVDSGPAIETPVDSEPESDGSNESDGSSFSWFWLCMVFVMFTFGGWNDIAFVSTEVVDSRRNLFWSLVLGTGLVLAIYLLFNFALIYGLGFEKMQEIGQSYGNAPAVLMEQNLGQFGKKLVSLMVCISCLGAMNGMVFTSPRIYWATATDYPRLNWLAGDRSGNGWWRAMVLQAIVTLLFIFFLGAQKNGFDTLANANAPYFWLFLGLTVVAMIVLRIRSTGEFSGYRVPGFPLLPLIFFGSCVFMIYRSADFMISQGLLLEAIVIGGWVLLGALLSFSLEGSVTAESDSPEIS